MDNIKSTDSYFLEGSGTTIVESDNGVTGLAHIQSMKLDLTSSSEKIYGGETNTPVYVYQSEKGATITMKNASMPMTLMADTQGVVAKKDVNVFASEDITVGADGEFVTANTPIAGTLHVYNKESGELIKLTDGKADVSLAGKKVVAVYDYKDSANTVGVEILSTSMPGYVRIRYRSKVLPQKDGRKIRLLVDIAKARSDGSFSIDSEHKNAFAPEAKFEVVDPENGQPMVTVAYQDVTNA